MALFRTGGKKAEPPIPPVTAVHVAWTGTGTGNVTSSPKPFSFQGNFNIGSSGPLNFTAAGVQNGGGGNHDIYIYATGTMTVTALNPNMTVNELYIDGEGTGQKLDENLPITDSEGHIIKE